MSESADTSNVDILIVEDDAPIARLMALHLRAAGFSTATVENGDEALRRLSEGGVRLVVLDRMLPGSSGMKILRWLRGGDASRAHLPVLMVTALGMTSERIEGLNEGADDYLSKPFEPGELVARVKSLMRRTVVQEAGGVAAASGLQLDPEAPAVFDGRKRIELRPMEYRLLQVLLEKPGKTRSREYLLDHVWGRDVFVEPRTVDVTVKRLRKALQEIGRQDCIETVRGMGYRYLAPQA
ncbi:MAG TPA: response regulator [Mariprofundaceae bacterium]|nr:response regulator [Mariprofundaceae bacterium]